MNHLLYSVHFSSHFTPPAPEGKLSLGQYRMELRKTHSTTVDVFHKDYTKVK